MHAEQSSRKAETSLHRAVKLNAVDVRIAIAALYTSGALKQTRRETLVVQVRGAAFISADGSTRAHLIVQNA